MVPFCPEPLEELRERFPRALEHVYDIKAIHEGGAIRPGEVQAQIFDHSCGIRIVVGREKLPDGTRRLHVSSSVQPGSRLYRRLMKHPPPSRVGRFGVYAGRLLCKIAGGRLDRLLEKEGGGLRWAFADGVAHWCGADVT